MSAATGPKTGTPAAAKQVWFAGSHSDVGGGYPEPQLSDIALQWMVCEAVCLEDGLRLQPCHDVRLDPSPYGKLHDPRAGGLARLYRRQARSWPPGWGRPTIHQSVLDRIAWSRDLEVGPVYRPRMIEGDRYRVEPWSGESEGSAARRRAA